VVDLGNAFLSITFTRLKHWRLAGVPSPDFGEALPIGRPLECAFQLPMTIGYMAELTRFFQRIFPRYLHAGQPEGLSVTVDWKSRRL
jgi:hypothetical protein